MTYESRRSAPLTAEGRGMRHTKAAKTRTHRTHRKNIERLTRELVKRYNATGSSEHSDILVPLTSPYRY